MKVVEEDVQALKTLFVGVCISPADDSRTSLYGFGEL
jgi:hypothetical protein